MKADGITGNKGAYIDTGFLGRFIPEPLVTGGKVFGRMLSGLASGGATPGIDSDYRMLIEKQIEIQNQLQQVSMLSNIEKARHETQMATIRNIRVG